MPGTCVMPRLTNAARDATVCDCETTPAAAAVARAAVTSRRRAFMSVLWRRPAANVVDEPCGPHPQRTGDDDFAGNCRHRLKSPGIDNLEILEPQCAAGRNGLEAAPFDGRHVR